MMIDRIDKVYMEETLLEIIIHQSLTPVSMLQLELQEILSGSLEVLLVDTVKLIKKVFLEAGLTSPRTIDDLFVSASSMALSTHPRLCKTLWVMTRSTILSRQEFHSNSAAKENAPLSVFKPSQASLSHELSGRSSQDPSPLSSTEVLKEKLISSRSEVSTLYTRLTNITQERDVFETRVLELESQVILLKNEIERLRSHSEHLTSSLKDADAKAELYLPFKERCKDLRDAERVLHESLSVTPHLPPFHDLTTLGNLEADPHASRLEMSYFQRSVRLRYVNKTSLTFYPLASELWSLEANNALELSGVNHPSLAQLIKSAPPASPGYSVWVEPSGARLNFLIRSSSIKLSEVISIALGLIKSLETLSKYRVQTLLPRLDAILYDRTTRVISLAEPCALTDSVLNPPEFTLSEAPKMYLLSQKDIERAWVFGASKLIKLLITPNDGKISDTRRILAIALKRAAKRCSAGYSKDHLDDLHNIILNCLSLKPEERTSLNGLKLALGYSNSPIF
jgi:hypothetical protein